MIKLKEILSKNDPISKKLRIHFSKTLIKKLEDVTAYHTAKPESKPHGLWYGFGREWIDYVYSNEMTSHQGKYIYFVKLKQPNKIVRIKDSDDMNKFTDEYYEDIAINWKKVSEKWSGIEINPYQGALYRDSSRFGWYGSWSIASGCIWGVDVIDIRLIYPKLSQIKWKDVN